MVKVVETNKKSGIVAAALAELKADKVKEATAKLKDLYSKRDKARKVLKNLEREIADYLQELEIDDGDAEE